ncbi:hypothetical protein BJ508DRAFT_312978 [Ascobolus immersus RN42]|uniref:Uncharacterized protein n=1 Tax=Ascobolus immersus RN42 TaxID=1160509 RepID=A0A3N4HK92_ASCIM|nr:hypothetical protein BJ508DRAFT_312978 [Ascobolus immersus RN42]
MSSMVQMQDEATYRPSVQDVDISESTSANMDLYYRYPLYHGKYLVQKIKQPPEAVLKDMVKTNPKYNRNMMYHFGCAIDLWLDQMLKAYMAAVSLDACEGKHVPIPVESFEELWDHLAEEIDFVATKSGRDWESLAPDSWTYLEDEIVLKELDEQNAHNRLFRVLKEFDFQPRNWSAAILAKEEWVGRQPWAEPMTKEEYGLPLGPLEFVVRILVEDTDLLSGKPWGDNKGMHKDICELADSFLPMWDDEVWWE